MSIFLLVLQAVPVLLELIQAAEGIFGGAGQGAVKKDLVMQGITGALGVAQAAGAKLTPEEQKAITDGLSATVDGTVALFNKSGWPSQAEGSGR